MGVAEILNRAADLLEKPGAWTQGAYARDALGVGVQSVFEMPADAGCFCIAGAVARAGGPERMWGALIPVIDLLGLERADEAVQWNDDPRRTQAEVVAALREAARKASEASA